MQANHNDQLAIDGTPPAPDPPRYDRDQDAEVMRLFDFPQGIRGQLALEADGGEG